MTTEYRLLPWIDEDRLETIRLCRNKNPLAFIIVEKRLNNYSTSEDIYYLCQSDIARDYLTNNLHRFCDIEALSYNRNYGYILRNNKTLLPAYKHSIINWRALSSKEDEDAIYLLKHNIDKIDWFELSSNSRALTILRQYPNNIHHEQLWLNKNPNKICLLNLSRCDTIDAREFIDMVNKDDHRYNTFIVRNLDIIISKLNYKIQFTYTESIDIRHISNNGYIWSNITNKKIIRRILETYKDIQCDELSSRPDMYDIIVEYKDKIYWKLLSMNPAAISMLRENQHKIDWPNLSRNTAAIDLLRENQDKIDWVNLCMNENAYEILKENQDKIDWNTLIGINNPVFKDLLESNLERMDEGYIMDAALQGHEWKMRMLMDYEFKNEYDENDIISDWIENASTDLQFEFIRKHFDEDHYYPILGENKNIFDTTHIQAMNITLNP